VEAAGNRWPEGWVRGYGYGSTPEATTTTDFESCGLAYVAQIVELTPGQRSRYQSQIRTLAGLVLLEPPCFETIEDTTDQRLPRRTKSTRRLVLQSDRWREACRSRPTRCRSWGRLGQGGGTQEVRLRR
jgi:hypothetical protein